MRPFSKVSTAADDAAASCAFAHPKSCWSLGLPSHMGANEPWGRNKPAGGSPANAAAAGVAVGSARGEAGAGAAVAAGARAAAGAGAAQSRPTSLSPGRSARPARWLCRPQGDGRRRSSRGETAKERMLLLKSIFSSRGSVQVAQLDPAVAAAQDAVFGEGIERGISRIVG